MGDRIPPQSMEAERSVLGAMLLEGQAAGLAVEKLVPEDFYRGAHARIFAAIRALLEDEELPDELLVRERLEGHGVIETVGGADYIHELATSVPSAANIERYAGIVKERSTARKLISACTASLQEAEGAGNIQDVLARAQARLESIEGPVVGRARTIGEILETCSKEPRERWEIHDLPALQDQTGGIYPGGLTIISGPPGAGKTTLLLQVVCGVARRGHPVYVFSHDQPEDELCLVLWSGLAEDQVDNLFAEHEVAVPAALPIEFDPPGDFTLTRVVNVIRKEHAKGTRWFLLDYLSLMDVKGDMHEWQKSAYAGKRLKLLAQELGIYVLVVQSSVKPDTEAPHPKYMAGGRELEHAADALLWLEPPPADAVSEPTQCFLFKSRKAGRGVVKLDFHGAHHRFVSWGAQ